MVAADLVPWAGLLIGMVSLGVAIVSHRSSSRAQAVTNALQERLVALEERRDQGREFDARRARLRLELRKTDKGGARLYVVNDGAAAARNIRVELGGRPLAEHPAAVRGDPMAEQVGPNGEISCVLGLHFQCAPPFQARVMWDDDAKTDNSYDTTLTW